MPASNTLAPRARAREIIPERFFFHLCYREAAQNIIRAKLQYHKLHIAFQRPIDTLHPTCCSVARHARVDNLVPISISIKSFLKLRRIAFRYRQSITCRQAVAESNYLGYVLRWRRRGGRCRFSCEWFLTVVFTGRKR